MNEIINDTWLKETAATIKYPPTPDVTTAVWQRLEPAPRPVRPYRLAFAMVLLLIIGAVAVPPVRARLLTFLRIGQIDLFIGEENPGPSVTPISLPDLPGQTTLSEAQSILSFPLVWPDQLDVPDAVYTSRDWGEMVTMVWTDEAIVMQILGANVFGTKFQLDFAEETAVNGRPAVWATGAHTLTIYDQRLPDIPGITRIVEGNVLIWFEEGRTFRLETFLEKEEAVDLAGSWIEAVERQQNE